MQSIGAMLDSVGSVASRARQPSVSVVDSDSTVTLLLELAALVYSNY